MPSFTDIQKALEESPSYQSIANLPWELRRLVGIPDSIGLATLDTFLGTLLPIISTAAELDAKHRDYWIAIQNQIPHLRSFLRSFYTAPHLWDSSPSGSKILIKDYPYYLSLMSPSPPEAGQRLIALKALLLIGDYAEYYNFEITFLDDRYKFHPDDLTNVANALRKCSDPAWKQFHLLLENVPDWPGLGVETWRKNFLHSVLNLPRSWHRRDYPGPYDYLFCLYDIANFVKPESKIDHDSVVATDGLDLLASEATIHTDVVAYAPSSWPRFSPVTGREVRAKAEIHTYLRLRSTSEENTEGNAPEIISAYHQESIASDEPAKVQAIEALEVRYTNYRTAMDNQRLPWTWDCLNPFEVRALIASLSQPCDPTDNNNIQCKFIVWLILLTGQPLAEILNFALMDQIGLTQEPGLIQGRRWQRRIPLPSQAFVPKAHQAASLGSHTETVTFELPECVTNLAAILGLQNTYSGAHNHMRLGGALRLDVKKAEQMTRGYLELLRGRELRLLLGRLRKVLSKEIMRITQSAVLTHLITALPTDAPPSGVYYSAFPVERLQAAYDGAVRRIIGGIQ